MTQKKQKFNVSKVVYKGITFDSNIEKEYYIFLEEKVARGEIKSFATQPYYLIQEKFIKDGKHYREIGYTPDFKIVNNDDSVLLVDIKGFSTPISEMRKKLFDYKYKDIKLVWLTYVKKYGGWIEVCDLKKLRAKDKKEKKNGKMD